LAGPQGSYELRTRIATGAALIATRGLLVLAVGLAANIVLARLLTPKDFGLVAIGMAIVAFASALADGGLGAGLIRRPGVTRDDLRAVLGLQVVVATALLAIVTLVAVPFLGRSGLLTAIMACALPVAAIATPAFIVLERELRYRIIAQVELLQSVIYYGFAVAAVAAGLGVWGLAVAQVVRAAAGTVLIALYDRGLFVGPLFSYRRIRPLLGFGIRFQANGLTNIIRDLGINIATGVLAGLAGLGIWTLSKRLLELPMIIFQSLWRVSFPAMSRVLASDEDAGPLLERAASVTAVASGLILSVFAAAVPQLVVPIFGDAWQNVILIVPLAAVALLIGGPISIATAGYLYAAGRSDLVLRATVGHTLAWFGVCIPLLPIVGVVAIGIGWIAGAIVDALLLGVPVERLTGARLFRQTGVPVVIGAFSAGVGIAFGFLAHRTLTAGVISALVTATVYIGLTMLVDRSRAREAVRVLATTYRHLRPKALPTMASGTG
jgi:O-antigen/teichoic acid export membrane protein